MNHAALETTKNGIAFSKKYDSTMHTFLPAKQVENAENFDKMLANAIGGPQSTHAEALDVCLGSHLRFGTCERREDVSETKQRLFHHRDKAGRSDTPSCCTCQLKTRSPRAFEEDTALIDCNN
ncbi:hypothetical protein ACOMHN_048125 [Nucella lapillus]